MEIEAIRDEIRRRSWDWSNMPDDETEGVLRILEKEIRPHIPLMSWEGHQGWAAEAVHLAIYSHPGAHFDMHHDVEFWRRLDQPAVYALFVPISSYSRVYTRGWNVWPKRRLEFMLMSDEERRNLPANWPWIYGPYPVADAPTEECRRYEELVDRAFTANDFFYLSSTVLNGAAEDLDPLRRNRTLREALFGFYP